MEILIIGAVLGLIPAAIAQRKGRSAAGWWVYGVLFFPLALLHSVCIRDERLGGRRLGVCPCCGRKD